MNRLESDLGDDGLSERASTSLKPFGALYRFDGRIWAITVWEHDWQSAESYCERHGMKLDGLILERFDA